jgi:hypothetical protein
MAFKVATKEKSRLRLAIDGPSGSGKTFTALAVATAMAGPKGRVAVLDSERGSASKYADRFRFIVDDMENHHPETYIAGIRAAADLGVEVLVIDSLSHAWMGKDGALEQVDKAAARSQSGNSFAAWREVTPMHNKLVDAILQAPMHVIVTMRSKTEYVLETNDKGKQVPRKIGLAPVQRDGLEYEFDVVGDMNLKNQMVVSKTRCSFLAGAILDKPGADLAKVLVDWLNGPTADEVLTYVQTEADNCFSLEDVKALNRLLKAKGGAYYDEAAIAKLKGAHERVMAAAATEATSQVPAAPAEAATAPAPTEEPPRVPATTEEVGLPMFDDKAAGKAPDFVPAPEEPAKQTPYQEAQNPPPEKLARVKAMIQGRLDSAKTEADFQAIKADCLKEGGAFIHKDVTALLNTAFLAKFPASTLAGAVDTVAAY